MNPNHSMMLTYTREHFMRLSAHEKEIISTLVGVWRRVGNFTEHQVNQLEAVYNGVVDKLLASGQKL